MPTSLRVTPIDADENSVRNSIVGHMFMTECFDQMVPAVRTPISDGSGGTQLQNIPCGKVIIRNGSGNQIMFIGGVNEHAPYSGRGLSFYSNESITLPIKNTNLISVMSSISGQFIEYMAFLMGNNVAVDTSGIYIIPDPIPPTLVSVTPTSGASGISVMADITASFSEAILSGSINTGSFIVRESGNATALSGTVALDDDQIVGTFTPRSGLIQLSKTYQATLGQAITDLAGNPLTQSGIWSWQTQSNPTLVSVEPTSGGSGIATNANITATFSQPMASGTITTSAFTVRPTGSAVNISGIAYLNTNNTSQAVFVPYSGLVLSSGVYFGRVGTSITDVDGNPLLVSGVWNWTTAAGAPPPDTTPPQVSGTTPVSGTTNVSGTNDITVSLSEQCQSGTVNSTNLFIKLSGNTITSTVSLASDLKTATINPSSNLLNGMTYFMQVTSGVKDLAGNFLSPNVTGRPFTTIPLYVSGINPVSGSTSIATDANIIVTFSQPMASGSINTSGMYIQLSGTTIPAVVTLSGNLKAAQINPTNSLSNAKTYYVQVTSGCQDVNGNAFYPPISGHKFTITEPTLNLVYNVSEEGHTYFLDDNKFRASQFTENSSDTWRGKNIQKVFVTMKRTGSFTSGSQSISVLFRDGTDNSIRGVYGTMDPMDVATTLTQYSFINTDITNNIAIDDLIEVQFLSGTVSNYISVSRTASDVADGYVKTYDGSTYSGASYTDRTSDDLVGKFYSTN